MSPWAKSGLTWVVVLVLAALVFTFRYQLVQGSFTSMSEVSPGICRAIAAGIHGPEDFEIDAPHNAIIVSSLNRQAAKSNSDTADGLYLLKLDDPSAPAVKLPGTPPDFHPHGISLFRDTDGSETLAVIDHKPNGRHLVEVYGLTYSGDAAKLTPQTAVQGGLLVSPNDVAAAAPDKFYVTNDHVTKTALGRFAEDYLLWPHADVLAFNGQSFRIATQRIALPNGILVNGSTIYVDAMNERRLIAYSQDLFNGDLTETGSLSIPARLDNISKDQAGELIVAGQQKPGTAQVFKVRLGGNGLPQGYQLIFSDDGHLISGASVANIWNGHLFIGSARDSKMLECDIK